MNLSWEDSVKIIETKQYETVNPEVFGTFDGAVERAADNTVLFLANKYGTKFIDQEVAKEFLNDMQNLKILLINGFTIIEAD